MPHNAVEGSFTGTMPTSYKGELTLSNEILGNEVQASSLRQLNENINHSRNIPGKQNKQVRNSFLPVISYVFFFFLKNNTNIMKRYFKNHH